MISDSVKDEILKKYEYIYSGQIVFSRNLNTLLDECEQYLKLYETLCTQLLDLNSPFLNDSVQVAEAIYYNTRSDYERKLANRSYYRGNCSAFSILFREILDKLKQHNLGKKTIQKSALIKLKGLIVKYIQDSLQLINHYQFYVAKKQALFPLSISNNPDFSLYYDTCKQIIFGENNFDDPSDQSEVTPALIRVMIELRLKWSMGISGYIVGRKPGNMNDFLEVYKCFVNREKIIVEPRFDIIKRIYEWGNIYIHTGTRSYIWLTGLAVIILNPFFYGQNHRWSGVRVESLATIYEFWDALKHHHITRSSGREINIEIFPYKPGFICTDKAYNPIPCENHYAIYENMLSKASTNKAIAAYEMKHIVEKGIQVIGNVLYERVRSSYISLREQEIRERAYYLWLQRGMQLWEAECDWHRAIEDDIAYLPKPD